VYGPDISPRATSTIDFTNGFLTGIKGVGSFPNSASTSTSNLSTSFSVSSSTYGLNLEVFPVVGTQPSMYTENDCGGYSNPTNLSPTTTTLNLTSITITATPTISPAVNYVCSNQIYTIPGNVIPTWTVTPAGNVTFEDACGFSTPGVQGAVIFANCNEEEAVHFEASPNPAKSMVNITPHAPTGTPLNIEEVKIFDLQGNIRSDMHYGNGQTQTLMDISKLENGVYFVLIYSGKTVERKKILVQR
jgi:hypothetical protein